MADTTIATTVLHRGDLRFPARIAGPPDGEVVFLLHGFPQTPECWAEVMRHLAPGGRHLVAPAQRGYAASARPRGVDAYHLDELVADVLAMADDLGRHRFSVVGHDWGGAVAWALAARHPDRVRRLAVLSTPHPAALVRSMKTGLQGLRSAYMGLFRLPRVAEAVLGAGDARILRAMLRRSGLPEPWCERYAVELGNRPVLAAALAWYRATPFRTVAALPDVDVPTRFLWSSGDVALGRTAAEATAGHVTGPYRFVPLDGASHWLPETAPELVADHVREHLDGDDDPGQGEAAAG